MVRRSAVLACAAWMFGCGGEPPVRDTSVLGGFHVRARLGGYTDGSGRVGAALLVTLRDEAGHGPSAPWQLQLSDAAGPLVAPFSYDDTGAHSFRAWWWPEAQAALGRTYTLRLTAPGGDAVDLPVPLGLTTLDTPQPALSADGARLEWAPVPGALAYACEVYAGGALQLALTTPEPGCDVGALPSGSYGASVVALGADLAALGADGSAGPDLPAAFAASEGHLAFARGQGAAVVARTAGGAIAYGRTQPGLAVWFALAASDGTPDAAAWSVEVSGPGIPADAPLAFTYPAGTRSLLFWDYERAALSGRYSLTARSGARVLSTTFALGEPAALPLPSSVRASASPSGGATVQWTPVPGAVRYVARAWRRGDVAPTAVVWTDAPPAHFPSGTFPAGQTFDVYVAATDVPAQPAAAPAAVRLSENAFDPASFTAQ